MLLTIKFDTCKSNKQAQLQQKTVSPSFQTLLLLEHQGMELKAPLNWTWVKEIRRKPKKAVVPHQEISQRGPPVRRTLNWSMCGCIMIMLLLLRWRYEVGNWRRGKGAILNRLWLSAFVHSKIHHLFLSLRYNTTLTTWSWSPPVHSIRSHQLWTLL